MEMAHRAVESVASRMRRMQMEGGPSSDARWRLANPSDQVRAATSAGMSSPNAGGPPLVRLASYIALSALDTSSLGR